ncbi:WxL domain-containing protein [Enterococcus sp. LJL51]|uniref:WxL domain-containing protein n=1 Tax=Enterococcus sp. LJL51 TaxID=3416656 RepID=UPI003CEF3FE6
MKQVKLATLLLLPLFSAALFGFSETARAESWSGNGKVGFEGSYEKEIRDPEHPDQAADPGDSPSTDGDLRIDFVPQFNFWANAKVDEDVMIYGNAQLFHGDTGARGNFVQVSDFRGTGKGWLLQVRQETQLKNDTAESKELDGAVISLGDSWANSTRSADEAPIVQKDVIRIDNIGQTYNLAEAKTGTGEGSWAIIFGASIENENGMTDTLIPRLDAEGNPVTDPTFDNKAIYQNKALSLSIPGATKKDPVAYSTVITWILSELP